jgi:rhomboid protease GluP
MKKPKIKRIKKLPIGFASLFLINLVIYVLTLFFPQITDFLAFVPGRGPLLDCLGLFTYMFAHANFNHLAGNFIFGGPLSVYLENKIGSFKFLSIYFITGILGALFSAVTPSLFGVQGMIGSSVAIMGVVTFALLYSTRENLIIKIVSTCMLGFIFLQQYQNTCMSVIVPTGVGYSGHLGGMVVALFMYILMGL